MTYTPSPYANARPVRIGGYHSHDVTLEIENPDDPEGDLIEHEFALFFKIADADPDVGIMSPYVDDWFYAEPDGGIVPESVWLEVDKVEALDAERKPVSKGMNDWHERNLEAAMDEEF